MLVRFAPLLALVWLLAACGQTIPAQTTAATNPPAATTPTVPSVTIAAATAPTMATVTIAAATAPTAASATIAIGRTPEGYQMLGDPAAPVTLTFYSDFF